MRTATLVVVWAFFHFLVFVHLDLENMKSGAGEMLSDWEHFLCLYRTHVWFPEIISDSFQQPVATSPGLSSGF